MSDWRLLHDAARQAAAFYQLDDAETRARQALAAAEAAGASTEDQDDILGTLVDVLVKADKIDEARETGAAWLALLERDPKTLPMRLAVALQEVAAVAAAADDLKGAIALYRRARKLLEDIDDPWSPEVAECLRNHAELLAEHDRLDDAIPLFRRALNILETTMGPDLPDVCDILVNLGKCLAATGDRDGGKRYLWRGFVMSRFLYGHDAEETGGAALEFGGFLVEGEEFDDAAPVLHHALAIYEENQGRNGPGVAECLQALAVLHAGTRELELAVIYQRRAIAILECIPEHADRVPGLYVMLAALAEAAGRPDEAAEARRRGKLK